MSAVKKRLLTHEQMILELKHRIEKCEREIHELELDVLIIAQVERRYSLFESELRKGISVER